jgi:hypothetical protein
MHSKLEKAREEATVTCFEIFSLGTEENHKKPRKRRYVNRDQKTYGTEVWFVTFEAA